ncbi:MAG TPA: peptidylprolyl isomerase [Planctomycetota bacterium]|nr:peptidylprolyl isomerase [Planctomycetota bacterium]
MRRILIPLLALSLSPLLHAAEVFNGPALKINTQIVSIREVEALFADSAVLIQDKLRRGQLSPAALEPAIRVAWAEALETATQDRIMDQRADKRRKDIINYYIARAGGNISPDRAVEFFKREEADCVRRLRKELIAAAGGEQELRAALKRRGQTMEQWEAGLTRELFRRDVLAVELGPIPRSPAAARAFYEKNPDLFKQEEAWRLRRIRIAKSKFTSRDVALQAATLLREKLVGGGDFAELAARVSDDPEFVSQGGLLMRDGKTDLPSGFFPFEEKIAEKLKDGEVSEPIETADHFVLVQRGGYRPVKVQSFEEAAERAEALAYSERLKSRKKELFEKLKDETYIEVIQKDPPPHLMRDVRLPEGVFVQPGK